MGTVVGACLNLTMRPHGHLGCKNLENQACWKVGRILKFVDLMPQVLQ